MNIINALGVLFLVLFVFGVFIIAVMLIERGKPKFTPAPTVQEWVARRKAGESLYSIARSEGIKPSELVQRCSFERQEAEDILDPIADLQDRVSKLEGK